MCQKITPNNNNNIICLVGIMMPVSIGVNLGTLHFRGFPKLLFFNLGGIFFQILDMPQGSRWSEIDDSIVQFYVTLRFPPSIWVAVLALNCKQMNNGPESFHFMFLMCFNFCLNWCRTIQVKLPKSIFLIYFISAQIQYKIFPLK
jgi:hypothetical protein